MWAFVWRRRLRKRPHGPLQGGGDEVYVLDEEDAVAVAERPSRRARWFMDVAAEAERPLGGGLAAARRPPPLPPPPQRRPRRALLDVVVEHELAVVVGGRSSPPSRRRIVPLVILAAVIGLVLLVALFPSVRSAAELVRGLLDAIP